MECEPDSLLVEKAYLGSTGVETRFYGILMVKKNCL